jgi:hypothetical protein
VEWGVVPNPPGSNGPITGSFAWHNYIVGNPDHTMSRSDSQYDFAVIDTSYTFPTYMNALLEYGSGYVHMTGYPAYNHGIQTDTYNAYVTKDPNYSILNYQRISPPRRATAAVRCGSMDCRAWSASSRPLAMQHS